jgi:RNA polymerase sigma factor (sigma-70 family)
MNRPFRKLAEEQSERIFTFAYYSLRSREEAEDVTQEVLVKLWQQMEAIEPGKLSTWVMRVTRNAVIDAARRRKTKSAVFADGVEIEVVEAITAANGPNAEEVLQSMEIRGELEEALEQIEEPYRSIIVMREIQGMTYAEVAASLEMPLNTVKVYLHRGRKKLREALRGRV